MNAYEQNAIDSCEHDRAVAIQDGTHKVLSGEMTAGHFFKYFVDQTLFDSRAEYVRLVNARAKAMLA